MSPPAWFPQVVKRYVNSTDYFHLLGLGGAGGPYVLFTSLCTEGTAVAAEVLQEWRGCSELELIFRHLPVHSHKDCFFAWEAFLSENVVSSESSACGEEKGTCPLWQMFFDIPGRWNEAKRKLASTWALKQNKVILFQNIHLRWKKLLSSVLLFFFFFLSLLRMPQKCCFHIPNSILSLQNGSVIWSAGFVQTGSKL